MAWLFGRRVALLLAASEQPTLFARIAVLGAAELLLTAICIPKP